MATLVFKNPRFDALRNAIYHTSRGRFLDSLNRFLNFIVIVLGATAVSKIAGNFEFKEAWVELGVVIFATVQLVFDFGGRSSVHLYLQKRYYELLTEMETGKTDTDAEKRRWSAKLLTIAADEPLPMRALDAIAYNTALDSLIEDPDEVATYRLHVSWWQRRLRHIWPFQGSQFVPANNRIGFWSRLFACFSRSESMEKINGQER
jgi:hypothetical protein